MRKPERDSSVHPEYSQLRTFGFNTDSVALVDAATGLPLQTDIDSIHNVWFEFHEDILSRCFVSAHATLEVKTKAQWRHVMTSKFVLEIARKGKSPDSLPLWRQGERPCEIAASSASRFPPHLSSA